MKGRVLGRERGQTQAGRGGHGGNASGEENSKATGNNEQGGVAAIHEALLWGGQGRQFQQKKVVQPAQQPAGAALHDQIDEPRFGMFIRIDGQCLL